MHFLHHAFSLLPTLFRFISQKFKWSVETPRNHKNNLHISFSFLLSLSLSSSLDFQFKFNDNFGILLAHAMGVGCPYLMVINLCSHAAQTWPGCPSVPPRVSRSFFAFGLSAARLCTALSVVCEIIKWNLYEWNFSWMHSSRRPCSHTHPHIHSRIRFAATCEPHMFLVRHRQRHLQNVHMEFHVGIMKNATCNMLTEISFVLLQFAFFSTPSLPTFFLLIELLFQLDFWIQSHNIFYLNFHFNFHCNFRLISKCKRRPLLKEL